METIKKLSFIALMLSTALVQTIYQEGGYYGSDGFAYTSEGHEQKKAYQQHLSERLVKVGALGAGAAFVTCLALRPFIPGLITPKMIASLPFAESLKTVTGCARIALGFGIGSMIVPLAESAYRVDEGSFLPPSAIPLVSACTVPAALLISEKKWDGLVALEVTALVAMVAYNKWKSKKLTVKTDRAHN
jgi:hypothetical protein